MATIFLDASFIIAFDNEKDVHHKEARELWKKIESAAFGQYFISDYIFDEVISVSLRKSNDKIGTVQLGEKLLQSMLIINIDNHIFKEAWEIFRESKLNLSFTDCTNLVLLKLIGSNKIATFDKAFKEIKGIEVIS